MPYHMGSSLPIAGAFPEPSKCTRCGFGPRGFRVRGGMEALATDGSGFGVEDLVGGVEDKNEVVV